MEFVTLHRSEPNFLKHLSGQPADGILAVPVESMRVQTSEETVTFQLHQHLAPSNKQLFFSLARLFRLSLLSFTLGPVVLAFASLGAGGFTVLPWVVLSLLSLHAAAFARNDFVDHMSGIDRINEKGGSRVIQSGNLSAQWVQKISFGMLLLSILTALPIIYYRPSVILVAAVVALLGLLVHVQLRWGSRVWLFGDTAAWLCMGPLLVFGASVVIGQSLNQKIILMSSALGFMAVGYFEARHMMSMMVDQAAGIKTMPIYWGIDRAKKIMALFFTIVLMTDVWIIYDFLIHTESLGWLQVVNTILALSLILATFFTIQQIHKIRSPMSSILSRLPNQIVGLHAAHVFVYFWF